jgi:NADH:ubiquinone oxidoreductase subunit 5 (subunit L)/multisubunit Na+/H+ antiporter MnhA subunit
VYLIGIYNDRPTVGENATFVCFIYQLSDVAMLVAAAFSDGIYTIGDTVTRESIQDTPHMIAVIGLLVATLIKSSQFPFMDLLARSMEGPMPSSALGYGALSSHVAIVLLANMKSLWFGFTWARIVLASFGLVTAIVASLVARILADRKGAIAYSTAATIGVIMIVLASGQEDLALILALGNASTRMIQVLRSANLILDHHNLKCALGHEPRPTYVSSWLFKVCWILKRLNSDVHLPRLLRVLSRRMCGGQSLGLGKFQQWIVTIVLLVFTGLPFTPVETYKEKILIKMLQHSPLEAAAWILASVMLSVVLTWLIFFNVLDPKRFLHTDPEK